VLLDLIDIMSLTKIINKLIGDPNKKMVKRCSAIVEKINEVEQGLQSLTEEQLAAKTDEFRQRLKDGETVDDLMVEAFAVVKNAAGRLKGTEFEVRGNVMTWDMVHYDVQLIGGIIMHEGKIAEMKTGEGKTLVATLPLYLNALSGQGAFLVTVNDYLALRDADWMRPLLEYLGLTVGVIAHGQSPDEKKAAYACDITYGTNNEFGFDYLRDNMSTDLENVVQKELHYAIVDEVDSILIDEARTPLIISAPAAESTEKYRRYSMLIPQLKIDEHYTVDEKGKTAILTDEGVKKMEDLLGMENIYTEAGFTEVHHIEQALKAQALFKKDIDYMVKDGEVIIIDEFTGRLMPGRRYSEGLHQSIEAKEGVEVKRESKTLATITFQNYFRLFDKLAGMTGTAITEAEEFGNIYGLDTAVIPTNLPIARIDSHDAIYKSFMGKFKAVAKRVKELHDKGQPVLVGTISVEKSELLSKLFTGEGIPHKVLNAKHHEKEAEIVADAGNMGAVTIATNMAGRGTDIKLTDEVKQLGGLHIIGTERHESRRIDNQLRGRSGRQGDPGFSQFYVSMEDDLMRLFGGDKMKSIMETLKVPEDMPIENRLISRSIESAQKSVEGRNFDIRKHLVEYDDVMNKHREIVYVKRREILEHQSLHKEALELIKEEMRGVVLNYTTGVSDEEWRYDELVENFRHITGIIDLRFEDQVRKTSHQGELISLVMDRAVLFYEHKKSELGQDSFFFDQERFVYLRTIDRLWMEHIDEMMRLREQVSLRGYGQKDPLIEYKNDAFEKFDVLMSNIRTNTVHTWLRMEFQIQVQVEPEKKMETNEEDIVDIETGDRELLPQMKNRKDESGVRMNHVNAPVSNATTVGVDDPNVKVTVVQSPSSEVKIGDLDKVGRNDPCPCGSSKKYKKCHGGNV
jgi:preprotein translocase subunit SecA